MCEGACVRGHACAVLSKRKLQKLVDTRAVQGWTDPRFPTVQGILRAGLQLPALKEFIVAQGASRNNNLQQWDKIWAINKQVRLCCAPGCLPSLHPCGGQAPPLCLVDPDCTSSRVVPCTEDTESVKTQHL